MPLCCCHCDKINVRVGFSRPRGLGFSLVLVWVWARVWGSCPHTGSDTQAGRIFYICAPCVCAPGTAIVNSSCLFLLSKRICHVRAERRGRKKRGGKNKDSLCICPGAERTGYALPVVCTPPLVAGTRFVYVMPDKMRNARIKRVSL